MCNFSSRGELLEPMNQLPGPLIFQPVIAGGAHWALEWGSYVGCLPSHNFLQYLNVRLEVITPFTNCIFEVLQHNRIQIKELGSKHMGLLSVQSGRNCSFVSVRRQKVICESFVCEHCACINSRQDCIVCGAVLSLQDQRVTINVVNLRK